MVYIIMHERAHFDYCDEKNLNKILTTIDSEIIMAEERVKELKIEKNKIKECMEQRQV